MYVLKKSDPFKENATKIFSQCQRALSLQFFLNKRHHLNEDWFRPKVLPHCPFFILHSLQVLIFLRNNRSREEIAV